MNDCHVARLELSAFQCYFLTETSSDHIVGLAGSDNNSFSGRRDVFGILVRFVSLCEDYNSLKGQLLDTSSSALRPENRVTNSMTS